MSPLQSPILSSILYSMGVGLGRGHYDMAQLDQCCTKASTIRMVHVDEQALRGFVRDVGDNKWTRRQPLTTMFSPGHFSSLSLEDIPPPLPPSPGDILMALPPPTKPKGGDKASRTISKVVKLLVFDVLNIFRCWWFLSRTALLAHVISAQKAEDGDISWVEFDPPFHSHLVKCVTPR
jgi:hypothetical protein